MLALPLRRFLSISHCNLLVIAYTLYGTSVITYLFSGPLRVRYKRWWLYHTITNNTYIPIFRILTLYQKIQKSFCINVFSIFPVHFAAFKIDFTTKLRKQSIRHKWIKPFFNSYVYWKRQNTILNLNKYIFTRLIYHICLIHHFQHNKVLKFLSIEGSILLLYLQF